MASAMPLPLPLSLALEQLIKGLIKLDDETAARLDTLEGAVIRIVLSAPKLELVFSVVDREVNVLRVFDAEADVTIEGSLQALRSLRENSSALYRGDVKIEGDLEQAQALRDIVSGFDPDWEEPLSSILGDTVVHQLSAMGRDFTSWFERTSQGFRDNSSEWLQEEVELLAANSEVADFCTEVDTLRADVDRLEARIDRLSPTETTDTGADAAVDTGTDSVPADDQDDSSQQPTGDSTVP